MSIAGRALTMGSGGGRKSLYAIELPRSIYYGQGSEFFQLGDFGISSGARVAAFCGGYLYVFCGTTAYVVNPEDGTPVREVTTTFTASATSSIATDGETRIWALISPYVYEYNVLTDSITKIDTGLYQQFNYGSLCYDPQRECLWVFSGYGNNSGSSTGTTAIRDLFYKYDLLAGTMGAMAVSPTAGYGIFSYYDPESGYIFYGKAPSSTAGMYVAYYNPESDTHTTIATGIAMANISYVSPMTVGDVVYIYGTSTSASNQFVMCIQPTTGELVTEYATSLPTDIPTGSRCMVAYGSSAAWYVGASGTYKCPFFEDPPEDAPLVCKIYKGQKFHTLRPFELPRLGLSVTTQQQVATEDIEIKMYDYSAQGGQKIYIET